MARRLDVTPSAVSQHLSVLRDARLTERMRQAGASSTAAPPSATPSAPPPTTDYRSHRQRRPAAGSRHGSRPPPRAGRGARHPGEGRHSDVPAAVATAGAPPVSPEQPRRLVSSQ
ncbi:ArsR family transcriptional regulator [Streptomyces sp. NPDC048521]|uniref:ArsR family transcriptional regulator n=1 Tax=Streptomyces sp. NPDC048521 TaxID=3365566 RepID=UPI00371AE085